jgi:hypothetical protein
MDDNNVEGPQPSPGFDLEAPRPLDGLETKCWLCGRTVESREGANLAERSGIPIHRECLEDGRKCYAAGTPLSEPDDVIYLSATLFRT